MLVVQVDELDLEALGPKFENNPVFPARTNTEFVEVLSRSHVRMVVWERGAGRTLACGTGACATVVAGKEGVGFALLLLSEIAYVVEPCQMPGAATDACDRGWPSVSNQMKSEYDVTVVKLFFKLT
jgi:hypothetical protein